MTIIFDIQSTQIMTLKDWIQRKIRTSSNKPLLKLFLLGAKGQLEHNKPKPYGFYPRVISIFLTLCFGKWIVSFYDLQMNVRGYNWLVPEYIYKVREENHIYWQLARLANKLPATFTHYKWAQTLMYQINKDGSQTPYHSHPQIQNPTTFDSFLHEYNFPATPQKHAAIMLYLKNIKNPYNLQHYLRRKNINLGDWLRACYYFVYRELGLTNRWRYDEYVFKPTVYYNWEKIKYAHLLAKDRKKLYKYLDQIELSTEDLVSFFVWFL